MKKNILYLEFVSKIGGGQIYLLSLLERLDREKYNPIVLCQKEGELTKRLEKMGVKYEIFKFDNFKFQHYLLPVISIKGILNLQKKIKELKIDLIHCNHYYANKYSCIAAKLARVPNVWTIHNKYKYRYFERMFLRLNDYLLADSETVRSVFVENDSKRKDKVKTIHYGIDLDRFNPDKINIRVFDHYKDTINEVLIGIVARIDPNKGHLFFFNSFAKIVNNLKIPAKAIIIGNEFTVQGYQKELEDEVKKLGIDNKVKFIGFRDNIPEVLSSLDIVVLPSVKGEGFPISLIEALAMKKAVVSTNIAGIPELIDNNKCGFVVDPHDVDNMSDKLKTLIEDEVLRKQFGEYGRQKAKRLFDLNKMVGKTEFTYDSLLS